MKLEQCAKVSQGIVLSRYETIAGPDAVAFSLYTMKELSDSLGLEYYGSVEKLKMVHISNMKAIDLPITKDGYVLINLTSYRAVSVRPDHLGRLVPSNFVVIEPNEHVDPYYLEWFINEHPHCRKQLRIATQGAVITSLSIQMLRALEVIIPSPQKQLAIRNVYMRVQKKKRLLSERMELEENLTKHLLINSF